MFLIPWIAGATFATVLSSAVLALPAVVALRSVVARRIEAPLQRTALERNLVLLSAVVGGAGAVFWSDCFRPGDFPMLLLGFVAPIPLACVPWFAGEALSGASHHPFRALASAAVATSVSSWIAYALCWSHGSHALSPAMVLIELASAMVAALAGAHAYLAARGEPRAQLPAAALALDDL